MKIIISPAKSLDYTTNIPTKKQTTCVFLKEAAKISTLLKKKSPKALSKLMHISDNLATLNWQRNQNWSLPFTKQNARQSVFAFKGTVYENLDAYSLNDMQIDQLQNKLRILSGQYGLLKPLDLIMPYRLEMGTKLINEKHKDLYQFWGDSITKQLNSELKKEEPFINLASNEYFKVVKPKLLNANIITPIFKDFKNNKYKVIAFFAKKARGLMVRYIIANNIEKIEDLKGFNYANYAFDIKLSSETDLVFTR
ncbi:MAG: peroxide stress protein YaaA [Flavobacteriaceae bacterium]|nr:peroxide stress protein YaaA [Flavobacteriaceae bacterium]